LCSALIPKLHHDHIFPNTIAFKSRFFEYFKPFSHSFNPSLINWYINSKYLKSRLDSKIVLSKNKDLKEEFFKCLSDHGDIQSYIKIIPSDTNIISIKTIKGEQLWDFLLKNNIKSHLIGSYELKTARKRFQPLVRLCFLSVLINYDDVIYLCETLKKYKRKVISIGVKNLPDSYV